MPTIVMDTQGDAFSGTTWAENFSNIGGAAPSNGNRIVLLFDADQAPTSVSVGGNSATQRATRGGGGSNNLYLYDTDAITGSPTGFSISFAVAADGWLMAFELSGVDATTPRDTTFNDTGSGSNPSIAFTTGVANCTILGMFFAVNNGGMTPGTGYTELGTDGNWERWMSRADAGAAGGKTFDATFVNSPTWYGLGVAYRPVAVGAGLPALSRGSPRGIGRGLAR